MPTKHIVEKAAVAIEHIHEKAPLLNPRPLLLHHLIDALRLLLDRVHMRRQKPREAELRAFLFAERRPLVEKRIVQQVIAFLVHVFSFLKILCPPAPSSRKALDFLQAHCASSKKVRGIPRHFRRDSSVVSNLFRRKPASLHFTSTWHIFIARSASAWLSGVTPAQHEASTEIFFSG